MPETGCFSTPGGGLTTDELIAAADEALYGAKHVGRAQVAGASAASN